MGDILGGVIGGVITGMIALFGWLGKRRANRRTLIRVLLLELEANWKALDNAAAFSVPVAPEELTDEMYLLRKESLAELLRDDEWRAISGAYLALSEVQALCQGDGAWDDLTITRMYLESGRDRIGVGMRTLGGPVPTFFDRRMDELEDQIERNSIEMAKVLSQTTQALAGFRQEMDASDERLSSESKAFREAIQEALNSGLPVHAISSSLRSSLSGQVADKQLDAIDEYLLLEAKRYRLTKRGPVGS